MLKSLTSKFRTKLGTRSPDDVSSEFRKEKDEFKVTRGHVKRLLRACTSLEAASAQYTEAADHLNEVMIDVTRSPSCTGQALSPDFVQFYETTQKSIVASQKRLDTSVINWLSAPLMTMRNSIHDAKVSLD